MLLPLCLAVLAISGQPTGEVSWPHNLYLANGGVWRARIPVVVRAPADRPLRAESVHIAVGVGEERLPLAGVPMAALRVCNDRGEELLYDLRDAGRKPIREGKIPEDGILTVPVDCPAGEETRIWVYFDNPRAWAVPDYLEGSGELVNGDLEEGEGDTPTAWAHDAPDAQHRASWTTEEARSGKRSLKLEVAEGAEPSWISTRQGGLRIIGGARYRMTAWVKARGVVGYAGWYIHLGNADNYMIESPMLSAGDGTYDWKEVSLEFRAPREADRADLGTVLRGTGVAWFDDVRLELLDTFAAPQVRVLPVERLAARSIGQNDPWWSPSSGTAMLRVPVQVANWRAEPWSGYASMGTGLLTRLQRHAGAPVEPRLISAGKEVRHHRLGGLLLFETSVPPSTIRVHHLYAAASRTAGSTPPPASARATVPTQYAPNPAVPGGMNVSAQAADPAEYARLLASPRNMVRNPSFEEGGELPHEWPGGSEGERPEGVSMGLVEGGLFGRRCVRLTVPAGSKLTWTGWRQSVPVQPGRNYLLAAWLRCKDLVGGVQLHVHMRQENGELCRTSAIQGAGPALQGTTGWTLLSGLFRTPEDCRIFQIHLTMLASGTVWHDGVVLLEVEQATVLEPETRSPAGPELRVWQVNPVIKVFREDLPPRLPTTGATPTVFRMSCAGNEYEPLQIAVRSTKSIKDVRVVIDPPRSAGGGVLRDWDIGVVGYVPIDVVTNYYSDSTPAHYRKVPRGPEGSDGWTGWWPDPILPRDRCDLAPGKTQPFWLTLYVPRGTPPGVYKGRVRLLSRGTTLATVPLEVRVRRFSLPEGASLKAIYDTRQSGGLWQLPGKSVQESREEFWRFLAKRRLCPDTIRPEPSLAYRDGQVVADFTEFDRAAKVYFDECRFPHAYTPWHFYLFGWGHVPGEKFGERPYEGAPPYEGADRSVLRPEYRRAYQACLKTFWEHIKARGWADRFVLYISDEPADQHPEIRAQMKALCDMIHEVDPAIPIYCSTWHHQPEWDGKLDVWGIGHYGIVPVEKMEELKKGGVRIWWTTDGQMCTDTPYCAIERLLPYYCMRYGAEAYEFWGVDWLTYDPYRFGWHAFLLHDFGSGAEKVYVRYPNGDGFLAYPPKPRGFDRPVPSLRLEQAREGVEDYEYMKLLKQGIDAAKRAGKDVGFAEAALREAMSLAPIPCEIGRYSTRILPNPDTVLRVRERMADALDRLMGTR